MQLASISLVAPGWFAAECNVCVDDARAARERAVVSQLNSYALIELLGLTRLHTEPGSVPLAHRRA
jgi:hypothetical protein